jgi:hypothetical protein
MFTQNEIEHIKDVKNKIRDYLAKMESKDWWNGTFQSELYLTGGAIASLIQVEEPKDWDFYTTNTTNNNLIKEWLTSVGHDSIADVDEKYKEVLGQDGKMITANAITMKNGASFITILAGTPQAVRDTFDYVHCTPYYDLATDTLHISKMQYVCCKNKLLVVNNANNVKDYRQDKFLQRGYKKKSYFELNGEITKNNA